MRIAFHINFSGQCEEAFEFYQAILGGETKFLSYENSPAKESTPLAWRKKIVHGSFTLNDMEIAGADVLPGQYYEPKGFQLLLQLTSEAESQCIVSAFSEGGCITMALQKTFWSPCYDIVVDRFGIPWEINCAEAQTCYSVLQFLP